MPSFRHPTLALAALALGALTATAVAAQSPTKSSTKSPTAPRVSTRLSDADGPPAGRLSVDLDPSGDVAPEASSKALPEASSTAVETAPEPGKVAAAIDHLKAGHVCSTGDGIVDQIVREESSRSGLDPCFVVAVMGQESNFSRWAVSPKGACGFMQLMPETARRFGVTDLFDPRQNIAAGTRYLRFLLDRFSGSMELALAGYNAGEGAVERYGNRIPPFAETQNYVRVITGRYLTVHAARLSGLPAPAPPKSPEKPAVSSRISVDFDEAEKP